MIKMVEKSTIVLVVVLITTSLLVISCVPEVSEKGVDQAAVIDKSTLTDEEILQQYPDDLDQALAEIDSVFEE